MGEVYLWTDNTNGLQYVGRTTGTTAERWSSHVAESRNSDRPFLRAIREHGPRAFTHEVLFKSDDLNELRAREKLEIEQRNTLVPNGYNLSPGDTGNGAKPLIALDAERISLEDAGACCVLRDSIGSFTVPMGRDDLLGLITELLSKADRQIVKLAGVKIKRQRDGIRILVGSSAYVINYRNATPLVLNAVNT